MTMRLSRRGVLGGATGLAAALAAPGLPRAQGGELRLLTWEGYAEPEWLDAFKAATGAEVSVAYAGSADEMFARMQGSGGADFDLVSFDTSLFPRYVDAGLVAPLDPSRVPNLANLAPAFRDVAATMRDGRAYGVPFAWGSLPLIYDAGAFPEAPPSWRAMWEPAYAQQVLCMDDANNCVTLGGLILGVADPFDLSQADMAAIRDLYLSLKPNLLSFYAGFDEGAQLFAQNAAVLMYSMGEPQVPMIQEQGVDAALTIPAEGAIGWLDCWEVSARARDPDLAHAWLDAVLSAETGRVLTERIGYGNTTNAAVNDAAGLTYGDRLTWLQPAEDYEARVALWNEIKAG